MVAFVASAYLTLIIVTIYYLPNHQQTASPADQVIVESLDILLHRRFETA
jgi:hypothetical protein